MSITRINNSFQIIDQTLLPEAEHYITIENYDVMIDAIKTLKIRGAPSIGIAALAAAYLGALCLKNDPDFYNKMIDILDKIENSRPTAVNLFHATNKVKNILSTNASDTTEKISNLVDELFKYELNACEEMAEAGYNIIPKHINTFLTHCNTGSLATYGSGTALGVLKRIAKHRNIVVYVTETRPLLQGARLTIYELEKEGINSVLITDSMAAWTIKNKNIQAIITGADRIARNGDTANKIGTYNLAIIAKHFKIPFYVVAPDSTVDNSINSGEDMIIEERDASEIKYFNNKLITIKTANVFNPAFDITPAELITKIICKQ